MSENRIPNELLISLANKGKAIINLGPQIHAVSPNQLEYFDMLLIGVLNRTINLNRAFINLVNESNFIAAAPLIRINLDSFLRLYAAHVVDMEYNSFAKSVLAGEHIRRMRAYDTKLKLTDSYLCERLSKIKGKGWVTKVYEAGNSFVHFGDTIVRSSQLADDESMTITQTIGLHDKFIPDSEIKGGIIWMNEITDSIVEQSQVWIYNKCQKVGLDIEKLNDPEFVKSRTQKRNEN